MERLNHWMNFIASIGVIAGIVFLAYEIRVNTDAVRAESASAYAGVLMEAGTLDAEFMRIRTLVETEGWQAAPPEGFSVASAKVLQSLKHSEYAYVQWTEDNLDERLWEGVHKGLYQFFWNSRVLRDTWQSGVRNNFSTEFRQYLDEILHHVCSRRTCGDPPGFAKPDPKMISSMNSWLTQN